VLVRSESKAISPNAFRRHYPILFAVFAAGSSLLLRSITQFGFDSTQDTFPQDVEIFEDFGSFNEIAQSDIKCIQVVVRRALKSCETWSSAS